MSVFNPFLSLYKRIIIFSLILFISFLIIFLFKYSINIYLKILLIFLLIILLLSLISIFEIINSSYDNVIFWLIVSLLIGYFYWYIGLVIFFLSLLKIFSQQSLIKNSLKVPFKVVVQKNYLFLLLSFSLIFLIYSYQKLIIVESLPLSFQNFKKITTQISNLFSINNFSLEIPASELIIDFFKKNNILIPNDFIKQLPSASLEEIIYNSLQEGWKNYNLRKIYLFVLFSIVFFICYPILRLLSFLVGWFSLLFYYLFLKLNLVKITFKSLNKEILEI